MIVEMEIHSKPQSILERLLSVKKSKLFKNVGIRL
jgi:hypothetical protein